MDLNSTYLGRFFVENFALILISVVTIIIAIQHFKQHRRISTYTILLMATALILEICSDLEFYAKEAYRPGNEGLYYLALICATTSYILRPACIYFMIMMGGRVVPKKYIWITFMPLALNATVFLCAFIPGTANVIFGFARGEEGLGWIGGDLHYMAHVISAIYLVFLIYIVFSDLKTKHISHGLILLICTLFVVAAVVIESFFNDSSTIQILNTVIAVSVLVYYLYLFIERTETDGLTGLFNREAFYQDKRKMENSINGVIQYDMDGLKFINDKYGHSEGDKALKTIAQAISVSITSNMYPYRLGGDEFIVLVKNGNKEDIEKSVTLFREELNKTSFHCSVGSSYRGDRSISLKELIKESETAMYKDKEEFYKNTKIERRKAE